MRLSVAVLEDDEALREHILVPELAAHGFRAEGFANSATLYGRMLESPFDLAVLDIALDGEHGLDIAPRLRSMAPIGIVTLSGRSNHDERISGLRDSIDAWLTKPVEIDLLVATLQSVSRRLHPRPSVPARDVIASGWKLTGEGWHLQAPEGSEVLLNMAERRVLQRLFRTPNEPVPREYLIAELAGGADLEFDPHRLEMLIHRLRRKIVDCIGKPLPLRSVRGCGYIVLSDDTRTM